MCASRVLKMAHAAEMQQHSAVVNAQYSKVQRKNSLNGNGRQGGIHATIMSIRYMQWHWGIEGKNEPNQMHVTEEKNQRKPKFMPGCSRHIKGKKMRAACSGRM